MSEPYVDRPVPSRRYSIFVRALAPLFVLWGLMLVAIGVANGSPMFTAFAGAWTLWAGLGLVRHSRRFLHPEYVITGDHLELRNFKAQEEVPLSEVRRLRQGSYPMGRWQNRFSNCLIVETRRRLSIRWLRSPVFTLTPSDVDEFIAELERRAGRKLLDEG